MYTLDKSAEAFRSATEVIPGGVNSPVRAFRGVGGTPVFFDSGKGCYVKDIDDNSYVDFVGSWGPLIFGHAHDVIIEALTIASRKGTSFGAPTLGEIDLAKKIIERIPSLDMIRFVNSGTEATMSALRVARGFTKRNKVIKFEGCYHGHGDSFLIAAGSGATTLSIPDSPGVTPGAAQDTLLATFNDINSVKKLYEKYPDEIAALIIEPVPGNMGVIIPQDGFLDEIRKITSQFDTLLIFDEVMTGFRLARGGAQELFNITPDLSTFGKIIGGGLPVGAYGGKKEVMSFVAPLGPVYQAGTLSGNPLAVAAGMAMMKLIDDTPRFYENLEITTASFCEEISEMCESKGIASVINRVGSMFTLFFTENQVIDYKSALSSDRNKYARFFHAALKNGVYFPPSQFEAVFLSAAHDSAALDKALNGIEKALNEIRV